VTEPAGYRVQRPSGIEFPTARLVAQVVKLRSSILARSQAPHHAVLISRIRPPISFAEYAVLNGAHEHFTHL
jgi:hypothetical protein